MERYLHGLLVVIGGVCAMVVAISLRIFDEDDATNSECPANADSSDEIVAVDAIDEPFDGEMETASPTPLPVATIAAAAASDAIVCVPFIVCFTLEICLCAFVLASVPASGLTFAFVIISNAFDTFIVASSMPFKLLFEWLFMLLLLLWLLLLVAFVMSLIVSAPVDQWKDKKKCKMTR